MGGGVNRTPNLRLLSHLSKTPELSSQLLSCQQKAVSFCSLDKDIGAFEPYRWQPQDPLGRGPPPRSPIATLEGLRGH